MKYFLLFCAFGLLALWFESCSYSAESWKIGEFNAVTGELEKVYAPIK